MLDGCTISKTKLDMHNAKTTDSFQTLNNETEVYFNVTDLLM